jgi:hypothetical protein
MTDDLAKLLTPRDLIPAGELVPAGGLILAKPLIAAEPPVLPAQLVTPLQLVPALLLRQDAPAEGSTDLRTLQAEPASGVPPGDRAGKLRRYGRNEPMKLDAADSCN